MVSQAQLFFLFSSWQNGSFIRIHSFLLSFRFLDKMKTKMKEKMKRNKKKTFTEEEEMCTKNERMCWKRSQTSSIAWRTDMFALSAILGALEWDECQAIKTKNRKRKRRKNKKKLWKRLDVKQKPSNSYRLSNFLLILHFFLFLFCFVLSNRILISFHSLNGVRLFVTKKSSNWVCEVCDGRRQTRWKICKGRKQNSLNEKKKTFKIRKFNIYLLIYFLCAWYFYRIFQIII